jgi:hypothetical protein
MVVAKLAFRPHDALDDRRLGQEETPCDLAGL